MRKQPPFRLRFLSTQQDHCHMKYLPAKQRLSIRIPKALSDRAKQTGVFSEKHNQEKNSITSPYDGEEEDNH